MLNRLVITSEIGSSTKKHHTKHQQLHTIQDSNSIDGSHKERHFENKSTSMRSTESPKLVSQG